jgi:hypothetical protein
VYAQTAPPPRESKVVYQSIVAAENLRSVQYDLFFPAKVKVPAWLSAIDVHSRKAFIVPMASSNSKRRTGKQIMAAMLTATEEMGDLPQNINADQEFNRQPMLEWYKENNVATHFSEPTQLHKNAVVERLHKTIKSLALRYWTALESKHDLSVKEMTMLIDTYNDTRHGTTGRTPDQMWEGATSQQSVVTKAKSTASTFEFKVGQRVRTLAKKRPFGGDASQAVWSNREYVIESIVGARFTLKTLQGTTIEQTYAAYQL